GYRMGSEELLSSCNRNERTRKLRPRYGKSSRCTKNRSRFKGANNMPVMTRKHFQLIADVLANVRTFSARDAKLSADDVQVMRHSDVVDLFASVLARTNPQFKRQRFVDACENLTGK